jgi:hypothetical protein
MISVGCNILWVEYFLILKNSPGCQTLSNAWLTSKSAAVQISRALLMVSATRFGGTSCTIPLGKTAFISF